MALFNVTILQGTGQG